MMIAAGPTFTDFYQATHGYPPFPWQARLAEQVAGTGEWPSEIGVPTGLGKTACLDIAVWWLASQADREPDERTAPTRIWWVVNRRLLVDSTAEHAERLARALEDPSSAELSAQGTAVVAEVAERLRRLSAIRGMPPLDVIRLRGGVASRTPSDPSRPTVLLCTLPMYGSRLLFRGYGSNLRSIDAAMAGTDSLLLLDEAHLAPHLRSLMAALGDCTRGSRAILGGARSSTRLTSLTATGDAQGERFDLDQQDEANPTVRQRLDSAKPLEIRRFERGDVDQHLSQATLELLLHSPRPASHLVFANTPKTARATFQRLQRQLADTEAELLLLTGLAREREAERIRARILDPDEGMAAGRPDRNARRRHLVVVATQTLEVGADLDAEYLVTEACGVRALTQRLGRLNRLGRHTHSQGVYVHLPPARRRGGPLAESVGWPVYGNEPEEVLRRLEETTAGQDENVVDLSPGRVAEVLGPPGDDPGRAPEVLPGILWEWTKTTTPPEDEAPVEPYFSGIAGADYAVSLCWRVHVPGEGDRLWPRVSDREAVDVPIREVREALGADEYVHRLAADGVTIEETQPPALRPGDRLVLPADRGLLDQFGWNPLARECVVDASLMEHGLPLDRQAIKRLCGVDLEPRILAALEPDEDGEVDQEARDAAAASVLEIVRSAQVPMGWEHEEWAECSRSLSSAVEEARHEVPRLRVLRSEQPRLVSDLASEFDELSLSPAAVELIEHGHAVGALARAIAQNIGLSDALAEVVERAGTLHDVGKADERFQRWLDPGDKHSELLAKSATPRHRWEETRAASGWPRGGRHEDLSARLVQSWLAQNPTWADPVQRDLLVHLVISHHGKGRPLVPPADDGSIRNLSTEVNGALVYVPADLGVVDWSQPGRFRRLSDRFSPWGLALLEAVVRLADHAVSAGLPVPEEPTR